MYSSENHLHGNQVDYQTCTACSAVVKPGNTFSDAVIHKMREQDKCKCDLTSPSTCLQLLATYRLQEHAVRHTCVNLVPRAKCTRNRPKSLNTLLLVRGKSRFASHCFACCGAKFYAAGPWACKPWYTFLQGESQMHTTTGVRQGPSLSLYARRAICTLWKARVGGS